MTPIIRSVSRASSSSNASTSLARIRSTGSPYWRICASASLAPRALLGAIGLIVLVLVARVVVVVIAVIVIMAVLVVVVVSLMPAGV